MLAVNEIFGTPTFQGEGKSIGMPCYFLRLAGCNQHCVFCDTPYTWRWNDEFPNQSNTVYKIADEVHKMSDNDVLNKLRALQVASRVMVFNLVISGGEPMLQQRNLAKLVDTLRRKMGWWVEVETAGTIAPVPGFAVDQYNVSLKLENSNNPVELRRKPEAIQEFVKRSHAYFKFVVANLQDFEEIDYLTKTFQINHNRVYIMPEGVNANTIQKHAQAVAEATLQRGFNLTTRMQIQLYGNQRGV